MDILVKFFNKILDSGKFPDQWKVSSLTVIHKSGDINDCNNYIGISLSSSLSKLFTTLLQKRLQKFVDDNNLLNDYQAGFRPDHRTVDHIYTLKTLINKYVYKDKKPIHAAFVDFSKAFDSVWRQGLLRKLLDLGIDLKFYSIVKDMYSNTKFVFKKGNLLSDQVSFRCGVKQVMASVHFYSIFSQMISPRYSKMKSARLLNYLMLILVVYSMQMILCYYLSLSPAYNQVWIRLICTVKNGSWILMQIKLRSWYLVRESGNQTRFFILMDLNLILQKDINTLAMKLFHYGNVSVFVR